MPREVVRQAVFSGGELDPSCIGRRDLKAYASSLAMSANLWPTPQGPIRRRGGLAHVDLVRNRLEVVALEAGFVTAPNGGTPADLVDGSGFVTTTELQAVDGYVIAEIDFGAPVAVAMVDLVDYAFTEGGASPPPHQYPWWRDDQPGVIP
jgi:hypothetical protein